MNGTLLGQVTGTLVLVRDHRVLKRWTYLAMALGFVLLLLPMLPVIGREVNGSRLWISVGGLSLQPGELAKIALAIFFAGYLVSTRDALSLVGRRILGLQLPRARDLGPILVAWMLSVMVLVLQRDLGSSLLFFGLFLVMLYVATERPGWLLVGGSMFLIGAFLAAQLFGHVQRQSLAFFTRTQTGALVSRLNNDVIGAQRAFTSTLSTSVSSVNARLFSR